MSQCYPSSRCPGLRTVLKHSRLCWRRQVREALDRGQPVPAEAGPHDVAATVLAFFAALPAPFMPTSAAQVCDVCVPSVRVGVRAHMVRSSMARGQGTDP